MTEVDLGARTLFSILSYILRRQGTDKAIEMTDDKKVPYDDIRKDLALPDGTSNAVILQSLSAIAAGEEYPEYQFECVESEDGERIGLQPGSGMPSLGSVLPLNFRETVVLKLALKLWGEVVGVKREVQSLYDAVDKLEQEGAEREHQELPQLIELAVDKGIRDKIRKIARAHMDKRMLSFSYKDPATDVTTARVVEPYSLFCVDGTWFLYAWCRTSEDWRTFYIDGINGLRGTRQKFNPRETGLSMAELKVNPMKGIEPDIKVRVRFKPPLSRWAEEHTSAENLEREEGGSVVSTIFVRSIEGMKTTMLRFGDLIEVLEPDELREGLLSNAKRIAKIYS